jgi:phage-related minor tail protein
MTDPTLDTPSLDLDARAGREEIGRAHAAVARLNSELRVSTALGRQFGSALGRAFEGLAIQGRGLGDVLRSLAQSLSRMAFRAAFRPLEQAFGNAFAGLFAGLSPTGPVGGKLPGGPVVPFAKGGVIAAPVAFPLGRGTGLAGERGAEAIMPLARGPDGRLGVAASGSRGISVTFNVTTPDAESFRRSESQIAAMLARAVGTGQRNL